MRKGLSNLIVIILIIVMVITGCQSGNGSKTGTSSDTNNTNNTGNSSDTGNSGNAGTADDTVTLGTSQVKTDTEFTANDLDVGYEDSTATHIIMNGDKAEITGDGASSDSGNLTISNAGTYVISGSLADGQIIVDAGDKDKVHIILNGVTVTCSDNAPIYIKNSDKTFITLKEGTVNTLTDGKEYVQTDDTNVDGVIFSSADLTINGSGTLNINANYKHGIVSKDDLVITGGTYNISAVKDTLNGKDCVKIKDGTFHLTSSTGNGIQSKNSEDATKGYVYIAGGNITVTKCKEGIEGTVIIIADGTINVTAEDDGINAASDSSSTGSTSRVGNDGSTSDSLPAGSNDTANAGTSTGNTANSNTNINSNNSSNTNSNSNTSSNTTSNTNTNLNSYDNLNPNVDNSTTDATSSATISDQAPNNAAGAADANGSDASGSDTFVPGSKGPKGSRPDANGTDSNGTGTFGHGQGGFGGGGAFQNDTNCFISITGGKINVNALGDGIDSNGSLEITGGTVYVSGPTNDGNGGLDYNGTANITGGTVIVTGSTGMAQAFSDTSTQYSLLYDLTSVSEAGTEVKLTDKDGNVVISYTPNKQYQSIVISTPKLAKDETYTLTSGDQSAQITLSSVVTSNAKQGMSGPGKRF